MSSLSLMSPATLPALFEAQVYLTPDAVAAVNGDERLTYAELNVRANRFAHVLIHAGIGPEHFVAFALPRSLDAIVVLLGIVKSGAAYMPLDPEYPAERLAFMLDDACPSCLVTRREIAASLPGSTPRMLLDDAEIMARLASAADTDPTDRNRNNPLHADNPAYVIYTSGSTGRPKGVVVPHRGVASLASSQIERFAVTAESRVLQFASSSFDAAFSELCMTLLAGARLVLASSSRLLPGPALASLIAEAGVTHATFPPSALAVMPADALPAGFTLVVAGEACSPKLVEQWSQGRRMINAYGPTESTVCATMSGALAGAVAPPIGRPIHDTQVYVLNDSLDPVDAGMTGELYISGAGLARGYLGQPALTAERFVPNPFGSLGSRMYRTGDLACRRADGAFDFFGRADQQVKIRGFRVEPGEVEAALLKCEEVAQAAVVVREDDGGQLQLIGYAVPIAGGSIDTSRLRMNLADRLPNYMVPAIVVALESLPLTPNGKLDRNALPVPVFSKQSVAEPRTSQEDVLIRLFAEILALDGVGIGDSFFDLGGHSLSATRLISRIRTEFGVELELDDIFDTPTVAGLAARFDGAVAAKVRPRLQSRAAR